MPQINRTGAVHFHDASLAVWEEGLINPQMTMEQREAWGRQFKREVFARIVQALNRLGWTVTRPAIREHDAKHYGGTVARWASERRRECSKGDLHGELSIGGCHIEFKMWQDLVVPDRKDGKGRYSFDKEKHMPYVLRLEMERTRRRVRDYLCNVFSGYVFVPPKLASPNPDPLAWFNDSWDSEHEKRRGVHRFDRGPDGWPTDRELGNWNRKDSDGALLTSGATRWCRDSKGRLLRGRVYGGINGMWDFIYGPGRRDWMRESANSFFTYQPGLTPMKVTPARLRRDRLERLLAEAVKAQRFERAAVLRDILGELETDKLRAVPVA
jgi:hypothetical protein